MHPCTSKPSCAGPPCVPNDPQQNLVELMDNLNTFIGSSTKLVHSIKEQMEINAANEAKLAAEAEAARQAQEEAARRAAEEASRRAAEEASRRAAEASKIDPCSCPNVVVDNSEKSSVKKNLFPPTPPPSMAEKPEIPEIIITPPDSPDVTLGVTPITPIVTSTPMKPASFPANMSISAVEPETTMEIPEKEQKSQSSCGPKPEKCSKMVKMRKLMVEKIRKERAERSKHINESIAIVQKNLSDIQEQIRQLDRLYEDYEMINTPDGEVNPAALYKEIMKPTTVPCSPPSKPPKPKVQQIPPRTSTCVPACPVKKECAQVTQQKSHQTTVLTAVPLNATDYA